MTKNMTLDEWLEYGKKSGFFTEFCLMHDLPPMNDSEADAFYSELDPCIPTLRVWLH